MFISTISTALILFFGLIPGGLCYLCVHRIFHVSSKWYKKGILLIACYLLSDMIIYVGDLMNLPPTLLFFLFGIWFCCEDSPLKKLSLALMLSTTAFSFNALCDNYLRIPLCMLPPRMTFFNT